jgi:hypothetical protein
MCVSLCMRETTDERERGREGQKSQLVAPKQTPSSLLCIGVAAKQLSQSVSLFRRQNHAQVLKHTAAVCWIASSLLSSLNPEGKELVGKLPYLRSSRFSLPMEPVQFD